MREFLNYCKQNKIYICIGLMFLYVLPLVINGIPYEDDISRIRNTYGWDHDGRLATTKIMNILSLGSKILYLAPLPLLLSLPILTLAGYYFCYKLKVKQKIAVIFIPLGIIISPFLLNNLSFQYDSLGMSCGLSLSLIASCYAAMNKVTIFNALFVFLTLSLSLLFYQSALNVFCILFIFCLYFKLKEETIKHTFLHGVLIAVILLATLMINKWISSYYLVGWIKNHSEQLSIFDFKGMLNNYKRFFDYAFSIYQYKYGKLCAIVSLIGLIVLFFTSNKKQKWCFPILILLMLFFIAGPLILLKDPIILLRVFLSFSGFYLILLFVLFTKLPRWSYFVGIVFIFVHFCQAYVYYNVQKKQYELTLNIYHSYVNSIERIGAPIYNIKTVGYSPNTPVYDNAKSHFPIMDRFALRYAQQGWLIGYIFKPFGLNIWNKGIAISQEELSNCNNVVEFNQLYNVLVKDQTAIFDFDKKCKTEAKYIFEALDSKNKITLNQKLKGNLELIALIPYRVSLVHNVVFELSESLYNEAQKDDNVFYIHYHEKGKEGFINGDRPINQQVKIGDRYYLLSSTNSVPFDQIDKIRFGFYNSNTKQSSASFEVNVNQ